MSPNAMNEDERRELIARQHRALYGETSTLYSNNNSNNNPTSSQDVRVQTSGAGRGPSPLAFDPFGMQPQSGAGEGAVQMPPLAPPRMLVPIAPLRRRRLRPRPLTCSTPNRLAAPRPRRLVALHPSQDTSPTDRASPPLAPGPRTRTCTSRAVLPWASVPTRRCPRRWATTRTMRASRTTWPRPLLLQ